MEQKINGQILKLMLNSATNNLINHKKYLNDLNVFPVPDGDTGTNMGKTFQSANVAAQAIQGDSMTEILDALATASLRGARGNSGVILSQITRGFAKAAHAMRIANGSATILPEKAEQRSKFAIMRSIKFGAETAYRAVMKPTEGTILTVIREMAEFAEENYGEFDNATDYFAAILQAGKESLARTPEMLPMLKQAGVVDAGGAGLIILIEGAVHALRTGEEIPLKSEEEQESVAAATFAVQPNVEIQFAYCTEFIIVKNEKPSKKGESGAKPFQAAIESKGDSIVVIEDDEIVKVHIHTNNPGAIMELALKLGDLTDIKIDNMKFQNAGLASEMSTEPIGESKEYGFVAVAVGDGIEQLFRDMGVDIIVSGGQTMNPSTQDILDAIESVNAKAVYVLPNNKNIVLAAEQAAELSEKIVAVIPTKSIPEGISAMFNFDSDGEIGDNRETMNNAASCTKTGYVTFAARDSEIEGLAIRENDIMGLCGNSVKVVGDSPSDVCKQVIEMLCDDDCGSISLYFGSDISEGEANDLSEQLEEQFSMCDVMIYRGGQPLYYYIISVE